MNVLTRIHQLITLAANESAESAEARTAAHVAARLIHRHGIELRQPGAGEVAASPTRVIRSRYSGRCTHCGGRYDVGDAVAWTRGLGAAHVRCCDLSRR
jgi:hypothetical protein